MTRDNSIDNLKGLLIFLVVLGHSFGLVYKFNMFRDAYHLIYLFHMPAFIFITGYFSSENKSILDHLKTIGLIYFWCQTFYAVSDWVLYGKNFKLIYYYPNYALWYLLVALYLKTFLSIFKARLLPIITLVLFSFFFLGYYAKKLQWKPIENKKYEMGIATLFTVFVGLFIYFKDLLNHKLLWRTGSYHIYENSSHAFYISIGVMLFTICIIYFLWIYRSKFPNLLTNVGKNSLYIYIGHILFIDIFRSQKLEYFIKSKSELLLTAMPFLLTIFICYIFTRKPVTSALSKIVQFPFNSAK